MKEAVVLFSGAAGAWELGCDWAGVRPAFSCEKDETRAEMLALNFPEILHHGDVTTLSGSWVRRRLGKPDGWSPWLVCGSPPCQDASVANPSGKGLDGARTGLFRDGVWIVRELRPNWVAFENVNGLKDSECHTILGWLGEEYKGWVHRMGDEDVGAPHRGWRKFIIARRMAETAREPEAACGQSWKAASDSLGAANQGTIRTGQSERKVHQDRKGHAGFGVSGAISRRRGARRVASGHWRDDAIKTIRRHLRMADGLSGGLAKSVQEAYGDSFPPQLAQFWIESMMEAEQ